MPNKIEKESISNLILSISYLYPCKPCAEHLQDYLKENPLSFESKKDFSLWLCRFHNSINLMQNKQIFDCSLLDERWKIGPKDNSCDL